MAVVVEEGAATAEEADGGMYPTLYVPYPMAGWF